MLRGEKKYDLEDRTLAFAKEVIQLVNKVSRTLPNIEIAKQLIRSSGSVGANYIEANESLGERDFAMRIKICRKEAKESRYWLHLLDWCESLANTSLTSAKNLQSSRTSSVRFWRK